MMASGQSARRWLYAIAPTQYSEQGKNKYTRMANNKQAFKPPLSGEILGKLVEALQIRTDL